jgi:hypothetical protein
VLILLALTPLVSRGARVAHILSWALGAIMILNGVGHLGGSVHFHRWLPGTASAPLLLIASVVLVRSAHRRPGAAV